MTDASSSGIRHLILILLPPSSVYHPQIHERAVRDADPGPCPAVRRLELEHSGKAVIAFLGKEAVIAFLGKDHIAFRRSAALGPGPIVLRPEKIFRMQSERHVLVDADLQRRFLSGIRIDQAFDVHVEAVLILPEYEAAVVIHDRRVDILAAVVQLAVIRETNALWITDSISCFEINHNSSYTGKFFCFS